ncbi:hypothetical protein JCM8547_009196 [Rhodosporidiobolus lusitaniae]
MPITHEQRLELWSSATPADVARLPVATLDFFHFSTARHALTSALAANPTIPSAVVSVTRQLLDRAVKEGSFVLANWDYSMKLPAQDAVERAAVRRYPGDPGVFFRAMRFSREPDQVASAQAELVRLCRIETGKAENGEFEFNAASNMFHFTSGAWPSPLGPQPIVLPQHSLSRRIARMHGLDRSSFARKAAEEVGGWQARR